MAQSCARAFAGAWLLLSFVLLSSSAPKADARGYGGPRLGAAAQKGRHLLPTGGNFWATFQPTEESVPVAGADNREEGFDPRPLIGILTKPGKGSLEEDGQVGGLSFCAL